MAGKRPSILHVTTWKAACGIATYAENLANSLSDVGFDNHVASLHPSDWAHFLPSDVAAWEEQIVEKANQADIVHFQHEHGLYGYALGQRFAAKRFGGLIKQMRRMKKPFVTTFHTDICTKKRKGLRGKLDRIRRQRLWGKYVTKHFGPGLGRAIVHASDTRKSFVKHGFSTEAIDTIPHPCLAPRCLTLDKAEAKSRLNLPPDAKLLSIFGFVSRYKGHDIAIKTLAALPGNFHLAIVGGMHPEARDGYMDKLLRRIPDELKERVRITGWVDRDTADIYCAASDACLAPYRRDTLLSGSGAITWALSSGRPVLASKIDAFLNVNRLGNCMFMFTPEKTTELAWAIQRVIESPQLADRLVENAFDFANRYSWENSTRALIDVYRKAAPAVAAMHNNFDFPHAVAPELAIRDAA